MKILMREYNKELEMIPIDDRFSIEGHHIETGWHLIEWRIGEGRGENKGKIIRTPQRTYHPTLAQVFITIQRRSVGRSDSLEAIVAVTESSEKRILEQINEIQQRDFQAALRLLENFVEFAEIQAREGLIDGAADPDLFVRMALKLLSKYSENEEALKCEKTINC